jgi:uncharacterized protein
VSNAKLDVNGVALIADLSGALIWDTMETVVVADLHFEKGSAYAKRGTLLPPYDSRATLDALANVLKRYNPKRVICLGDSFHDDEGPVRLADVDRKILSDLAEARDWIWIAGNHDPSPPEGYSGRVLEEVTIGSLVFRHEAIPTRAAGEVSGHFHPKARLTVRGRRITGRCFVTDGKRLVLPAFGAYAGGLDVLDPALSDLFVPKFTALVLGQTKVHRVSRARLARSRR